jgi:hypothetical protein
MYQKLYGCCVVKIDDHNNICGEYASMIEAARQHGLSKNCIRNCVKGYSKQSAGFRWAYKKDIEKQTACIGEKIEKT